MKKYLVIPCLFLTVFLCQCKKSKHENKNGGDAADRRGINNKVKYFDTAKFTFETPEPWPASPISISLWVKPKDDKNENFFLLSNENAFGFYQNDADIGFVISSPVTNSAMTNFGYGWIHI